MVDMMNDSPVPNSTSDNYSGLLNTPRPFENDQNRGPSNLSNDLADEDFKFVEDFSFQPNADLLQKIEILQSDVQAIKNITTVENKKILREQKKITTQNKKILREQKEIKRQNQLFISKLEMLTQTNTQRFVQSNNSEFRLSVPEIPTIDEPVNDSIENAQAARDVSSLPSESNIRTDDQNLNRFTTTNELLFPGDETDKILEKNQGKIPIPQWCYEINVRTTDDAPTLSTSTEPKIQPENKKIPMNCRLSPHVTTSTENLLKTPNDESIKVGLLHPVYEVVSEKNERDTIITDCFGEDLVLLVYGDSIPNDARIEMASVFTESGIQYHSIHQFPAQDGGYKNFDSRQIKSAGNSPQRIELNNVRLHRGLINDMRKESTITCKNSTKKVKIFKLELYPSKGSISTNIINSRKFNKKYNYKRIQIAFRFVHNGTYLFNGKIFYTNLLYEKPIIPCDLYNLSILNKHRYENGITFDDRNQCQMEYSVEIPEPFHCTLVSGSKWLEISIITDDNLNPIYAIDTGNGEKKNPNYIQIEQSSFDLPFIIIRQTLFELENNNKMVQNIFGQTSTGSSITYDLIMNNTNDLDRFRIQIRLIHSEGFPSESSTIYYSMCKPWTSEEIENTIYEQLNILLEHGNTAPKRRFEDECDYRLGLPVCYAAKKQMLCHEEQNFLPTLNNNIM